MRKYRNKILYLYQGIIYTEFEDNGDIYYKSVAGKILTQEQKEDGLFFSSLLEFQTYKYLNFWVKTFQKEIPDFSIRLVRQFSVVLIPKSECFPEYKHKVDFALIVKKNNQENSIVYLIESKGIITKDSMLVLRLLEANYQGISDNRYIMVFNQLPEKFPREFPKELIKTTPLGLISTLNKYIKK